MKCRLAKYCSMLIGLAIGCALAGPIRLCHAQQPAIGSVAPPQTKWGLGRLFGSLAPKPAPDFAPQEPPLAPDDPVSLSSRAQPSAKLYVAVARLHQEAGRFVEAEEQYRLALQREPDHLDALLGYARLKEQMRQPQAALELYTRAAKAHPDQPVALNHLGLCLARQGQLQAAAAAISRAVQLRPNEALYRNNLATLLVDMGRLPEAFTHLRAVHSNAVAYYNLGYLLAKKGDQQAAVQHFRMALQLDPSLVQARQWLNALGGEMSLAQRPASSSLSPAGSTAQSPGEQRAVGPDAALPAPTLGSGPQGYPDAPPAAPPGPTEEFSPAARPAPTEGPLPAARGALGSDLPSAASAAPMPPKVSSLRRLPPIPATGPQQPFFGRALPAPPGSGESGPSAPWPPGYRR